METFHAIIERRDQKIRREVRAENAGKAIAQAEKALPQVFPDAHLDGIHLATPSCCQLKEYFVSED